MLISFFWFDIENIIPLGKKGLMQIPHFKNQFWPVFMWDKKKRFANVRQNVRITRARIIADALLQNSIYSIHLILAGNGAVN